jgi:hypothetical protein
VSDFDFDCDFDFDFDFDFDSDFDGDADTRRGFEGARPTLCITCGPWCHTKLKSNSHLRESPT